MAASTERCALDLRERKAVTAAVDKLEALGDLVPYPHSSHVAGPVRELRLRQGRSRTRLLYSRVGERMVILACAPEAQHDRQGFDRAVARARARLEEVGR